MNQIQVERLTQGIDFAEISCLNPSHALINFSSMNPGKFERISWFQSENFEKPTLQMFFKDESQYFFLGAKNQYLEHIILNKIINVLKKHNLDTRSTITIGSSMGGYASIYYGFLLKSVGVISVNPLAAFQCLSLHNLSLWQRKAQESNWVDLDEFILSQQYECPLIHLIHGAYSADTCSANKVINALDQISAPYVRTFINSNQHGWIINSKGTLLKLIKDLNL